MFNKKYRELKKRHKNALKVIENIYREYKGDWSGVWGQRVLSIRHALLSVEERSEHYLKRKRYRY